MRVAGLLPAGRRAVAVVAAAWLAALLLPLLGWLPSSGDFPCRYHDCACATQAQCLADCCCYPAAEVETTCCGEERPPAGPAARSGCSGPEQDPAHAPPVPLLLDLSSAEVRDPATSWPVTLADVPALRGRRPRPPAPPPRGR